MCRWHGHTSLLRTYLQFYLLFLRAELTARNADFYLHFLSLFYHVLSLTQPSWELRYRGRRWRKKNLLYWRNINPIHPWCCKSPEKGGRTCLHPIITPNQPTHQLLLIPHNYPPFSISDVSFIIIIRKAATLALREIYIIRGNVARLYFYTGKKGLDIFYWIHYKLYRFSLYYLAVLSCLSMLNCTWQLNWTALDSYYLLPPSSDMLY